MESLIQAATFFLAIHILVSGTALRGVLTGAIGERAFLGLFSLASLAGLAWMISAYGQAPRSQLWVFPEALAPLHALVLLCACLFVAGGYSLTSPTGMSLKGKPITGVPEAATKGWFRITRHPVMWGVALWASAHLARNGDSASAVLFGTLALLAFAGPLMIDLKRAESLGEAWSDFTAKTSNLPFAAILSGRNKLVLGELGVVRLAVGVGLYAAFLFGHPYLAGVPAL